MKTVALGEVSSFVRGVTFKPTDVVPDGVGVMRTKNVQKRLELADIMRIPRSLVKRDDQFLREGDTLVSSANSWSAVGKGCWVPALSEPLAIGGFVTALRVTSPLVDARYLYHWYTNPHTQTTLRSFSNKTTNIANLNLRLASEMDLALPPLAAQQRIAAILDQSDAIRVKRRQALAHLDSLAEVAFYSTFGDPSDWHMLWPIGVIGDLARSVTYGTSAKAGASGRWPVLRMGNITDDGRIDLSDLKHLDLLQVEVPKYTVSRGDLLFNRTNSAEKVGKAAVVRTDRPLALAGYLVRVRFDDAATSEFVSAYLRTPHGRKMRKRLAKAAVNQANINATELRRIPIALPSVERRHAFAAHLDRIEIQRDNLERALTADDELFASLQSRAFQGEL